MPHRSSVPGLKFSSTTSTCAASRRTTLAAALVAQVDRDRPLVARDRRPPEAAPVVEHAPPAHRVAGPGRLDLDHVGAEVAEQLARERAGDERAELEDAQAVRGPVRRQTSAGSLPCRCRRDPPPGSATTTTRTSWPSGTATRRRARTCTPLILETADRAVAQGWLYARGGERTVVVLMHPRANFSHHYVTPGPARRRARGAQRQQPLAEQRRDADPRAGAARRRRRARRRPASATTGSCSCGNSGGASLFTFYLHQALAPAGRAAAPTPRPATRSTSTGSSCRPRTRWCTWPAIPARATSCCTRSTRRSSTRTIRVGCDPALDLYDPANGFVEPPDEPRYDADVPRRRYRAAQRARVERIDATARAARGPRAATRAGAGRETRDVADRRAVDRDRLPARVPDRRRPALRRPVPRPVRARLRLALGHAAGLDQLRRGRLRPGRDARRPGSRPGRGCRPGPRSPTPASRMTLPSLLVSYTGDTCVFPSDDELIADSLATDVARPGRGRRRPLRLPRRRRARGRDAHRRRLDHRAVARAGPRSATGR